MLDSAIACIQCFEMKDPRLFTKVSQTNLNSIYSWIGLLPSIVGIIPYAGIDLAVFSILKEKYQRKYPGDKPSSVLLLGL
jgi:hypothetical protein